MGNILQLRISLKHINPPILRRIEIENSMAFFELHRI
ncbi:MAG: hypothetical protein KAT33_06445 [Bacteroidales bacterium]|nr:hypothetical protein [Bacteroidales bacterium]